MGKKQIDADAQIHQNRFKLLLRYLRKILMQIIHKIIESPSFKNNGLRSKPKR